MVFYKLWLLYVWWWWLADVCVLGVYLLEIIHIYFTMEYLFSTLFGTFSLSVIGKL